MQSRRELIKFHTPRQVLKLFLLDALSGLSLAIIWLTENSSIGLGILLDWEQPEYLFVRTGMGHVSIRALT